MKDKPHPGLIRVDLLAPVDTEAERRARMRLCENRRDVFTRLVPWPALAQSWTADLAAIERQGEQ